MRDRDQEEAKKFGIQPIDLVIVDLYPFEETVKSNKTHQEIIEKKDIGGISLIRAAAKNYERTLVISHRKQYEKLSNLLEEKKGYTDINDRKFFAIEAFMLTSYYDTKIFQYFNSNPFKALKISEHETYTLRYGENPHQKAKFFGNLEEIFTQLHGKHISYNNLLDIDAAINLITEFEAATVAIIKHTNPCGLASNSVLSKAWDQAIEGDPEAAFGGIIVVNREIDLETAKKINKLFFEIIIAPAFSKQAVEILKSKKNRRILILKNVLKQKYSIRSALNGYLYQEKDLKRVNSSDLKFVTNRRPQKQELEDLLFANKIVKQLKSNAIAIVKNKQLIGSGMGQPSRVDSIRQAINKAKRFNFDLQGAVLASDAFFPFADSVELAYNEGIRAIIQPGGSIRDQETINFCNSHNIAMVFTNTRHFKH